MKPAHVDALERQVDWHSWSHTSEATPDQALVGAIVHSQDVGFVEPDLCRLVMREAQDLPDFVWHSALLPSRSAFIVLGEPLTSTLTKGVHTGTAVLEAVGYAQGAPPRDALIGYWRMPDGEKLAEKVAPEHRCALRAVLDRHHAALDLILAGRGVTDPGQRWIQQSGFPPFALALLLFMNQRIVISSSVPMDRGSRRRRQRAELDGENLTVLTFRRTESEARTSGEQMAVEWSCRWAVRGHWRSQWHPSIEAHVPTWIAPHIKGPDDKPFREPGRRLLAVER